MNGGLSPDYVLDSITDFEIEYILNQINSNFKNQWYQIKEICYTIAQVNSTKKIDKKNFMNFFWEKSENENENEIKKEDLEKIKNDMLESVQQHFRNIKENI